VDRRRPPPQRQLPPRSPPRQHRLPDWQLIDCRTPPHRPRQRPRPLRSPHMPPHLPNRPPHPRRRPSSPRHPGPPQGRSPTRTGAHRRVRGPAAYPAPPGRREWATIRSSWVRVRRGRLPVLAASPAPRVRLTGQTALPAPAVHDRPPEPDPAHRAVLAPEHPADALRWGDDPADRAAPEPAAATAAPAVQGVATPAVPADPREPAAIAAAVARPVPVGRVAATHPARSVARVARNARAASRRSSVGRNSTTCRRRRSAV